MVTKVTGIGPLLFKRNQLSVQIGRLAWDVKLDVAFLDFYGRIIHVLQHDIKNLSFAGHVDF